MKTITITGLSISADVLGEGDKQEAMQLVDAINQAIGGLNSNPQIFGGNDIDDSQITVESETGEYIDIGDCIAQGTHLTDCDEDGYCLFCGDQISAEEWNEERAEILRRDEKNGLYPGKDDVAN